MASGSVPVLARLAMVIGFVLSTAVVASDDVIEYSDISGDDDEPKRHQRVVNPADLDPTEAEAVYLDMLPAMMEGYAAVGPMGAEYDTWPRFNSAPYRSATHGQRYVNNYANDIAADAYGRYEEAGTLAVGSVIAKDSLVVTEDGIVTPGPLFVMEKMPEGFNYVTGDWRYILVSAEGDLIGETFGDGSERVGYCIACHAAAAIQGTDHLFFVPEDLRLP